MVYPSDGELRMTKARKWDPGDIETVHIRGSGPGGQNRNKRMSGVRVRHLPTGLVAVATERRSQAQNLDAALRRLEEKLDRFFYRPTPRVATSKTRTSDRKRLQAKTRRSRVKQMRRTSASDED
jgi:protein subunit release factor A